MSYSAMSHQSAGYVVTAGNYNQFTDNDAACAVAAFTTKGDLFAGTGSAAGARLAAGTNFFAPFYHSGETAGIFAKAAPICLFSDATEISVSNTTTETDIIGASGITIPANYLTTKNWMEILFLELYYNNTGSDRTITRKVYYGSASYSNVQTITSGGTVLSMWWRWFIRAAGGTSAQSVHLVTEYVPSSGSAALGPGVYEYTTGWTVDATANQTLRLTVQNSYASTSLYSKSRIAQVTFQGTTQ